SFKAATGDQSTAVKVGYIAPHEVVLKCDEVTYPLFGVNVKQNEQYRYISVNGQAETRLELCEMVRDGMFHRTKYTVSTEGIKKILVTVTLTLDGIYEVTAEDRSTKKPKPSTVVADGRQEKLTIMARKISTYLP
ncbi:hypothetical protein PENTCL1PPCAC_20798, partial [Pristionchus entomophagus]